MIKFRSIMSMRQAVHFTFAEFLIRYQRQGQIGASEGRPLDIQLFGVYLFEQLWQTKDKRSFELLVYEVDYMLSMPVNLLHLSIVLNRLGKMQLSMGQKSTLRAIHRRVERLLKDMYLDRISLDGQTGELDRDEAKLQLIKNRKIYEARDSQKLTDTASSIFNSIEVPGSPRLGSIDAYLSITVMFDYYSLVEAMKRLVGMLIDLFQKLGSRETSIQDIHT